MEDKILSLLKRADYLPLNIPNLLKALNLPSSQQRKLQQAIKNLSMGGKIARIKGNRYMVIPEKADLIPGTIRMNRAGMGFLQPDDAKWKEIVVPPHLTSTAMHEDHVMVRLNPVVRTMNNAKSEPQTGEVIRILRRRRHQIVGSLNKSAKFYYVIPDNPRINHDIYVSVPFNLTPPPKLGSKVVVKLQAWDSPHLNPEGDIVKVLGNPNNQDVVTLSVIHDHELPTKFPVKVLREAKKWPPNIGEKDSANRRDCRSQQVITIDPDDARDFDDAICLEKSSKDSWKLWVHIADVSHYVRPGTALDREAINRGNSTYLPDRVIPMLPENLSNGLCSLKPGVDRLTRCVQFLIANNGRILETRFFSAIIRSNRRLTYGEALEIIQGKGNTPVDKMIRQAHSLAQKMRRSRLASGSLDLDFPETKLKLDPQGRVQSIELIENDFAHQLIEEFMLISNEAAAQKIMKKSKTALFRIHEAPDEAQINDFRQEVLNHGITCGNLNKKSEIQKLLNRLASSTFGPALKRGFLKSMPRARYAVDPLGHYGLGKPNYTHFTSPIRRYADLCVHRLIFDSKSNPDKNALEELAIHLSLTGRKSSDAERSCRDLKILDYLSVQARASKPKSFTAVVTGFMNHGFFVDAIEIGMGGLVPLSSMEDDFYYYDANRSRVIGKKKRRIIRLGERLNVTIQKVDKFKRQVDFRISPNNRR